MGGRLSRPHGTFQICHLRLLQARLLCFQVLVSSHQEVQFRYERHHCNRLVVLYIMSKIVFFFGRHFLIFLRCGSDSWRKSPDVSSKFLPLPHKSGSSHGWCKTNQSMVSPVSTTAPSMLSPSIFEVNEAPI